MLDSTALAEVLLTCFRHPFQGRDSAGASPSPPE